MSFVIDLLEEYTIGLGLAWFLVFISCAGVLISEQQNYNLFTSMYHYVPCNVQVTTQIMQPVQINVSQDLIPATCFHTPAHPQELQIGAPPPVNSALWAGICLGLFGCLVSGYIYKNKHS